MACYHPLTAYRREGVAQLIFSKLDLPDCERVKIACGQCVGCRLERSRQWAIRCVHEASLYNKNCFITLTYAPEHLPKTGSLDKRDFQLFMKRLRKKYGSGVRYFHCGEYGERNRRPHYHACLFNFDFPDRDPFQCRKGIRLDVSKSLQELWPFGFSTVGDVTFESAAYVARYVLKKFSNPDQSKVDSHYEFYDDKGEYRGQLQPEYVTMSRRPGIGRPWFEKYPHDVYPSDRVVLRGREMRPPKYYDGIFQLEDPALFEEIQYKRRCKALQQVLRGEATFERLRARESIQIRKLDLLIRGYENA